VRQAAEIPARLEDAGAVRRLAGMSLLGDLDAFFTDHRQCGDLDAGVDGPVVWIACDCGARMARRADEVEHTDGRD
jgi:hypothetical protein